MFRLNRFMREIVEPTPVRRQQPPGPVVIWNLIRRCNLNCKHCYSLSMVAKTSSVESSPGKSTSVDSE